VDDPPPRADGFAVHPVRVAVLEWATVIMATAATVVGLARIAQNEKPYRLMRKSYKRMKKLKK
jgi:hypothetical protein